MEGAVVKQFAFALRSRNKPCLRESQNTFSIKKLCDKQFAKSGGPVLRFNTSAGIPFLHGYATSKEFEGWLAANLAWWRKLA